MYITWLGQSCFKIQDKLTADGVTLVTDPYKAEIGLKLPNFSADIITISHNHPDHNNAEGLRGDPYIVQSAGEFDIKGVAIHGIEAFHDSQNGKERGQIIIYRIEVEDISIAHLSDLGHLLDNKQLEVLSGIDVLFIPVGGKYTIDAKKAVEVVAQIEPRIIIPMHYKLPGLKYEFDGVEKFIKEIGLKPREEEKLKLSKKDLPAEDMELVILKM